MIFNDLFWHDSVIKSIVIDRNNPGTNDIIKMTILWPSGEYNDLIFYDVYWAMFSLNFGVVAEETIDLAFVADQDDFAMISLSETWKGMLNLNDLSCYVIRTISTKSEMKIIAKKVMIM